MAVIINNYGGEVYTDYSKKIVYAGSSKPTDENISEAEVVEEDISTDVASKRCGRRQSVLFVGADGKEDMAVREREKQHFLAYLREHKLSGASLSASKDDTLNRTIAGFVRYWKSNSLISENAGATAVYNFLNGDCGIPTGTQKKAVTNKWNAFFKDTDYGKERYFDIKDFL